MFDNVLVFMTVFEFGGLNTFKVSSEKLDAGHELTNPWKLADTMQPGMQEQLHDKAFLCKSTLKNMRASSAHARSHRGKWGPEGMLRMRVSGLTQEADVQVSSSAELCYEVGDIFEQGISRRRKGTLK